MKAKHNFQRPYFVIPSHIHPPLPPPPIIKHQANKHKTTERQATGEWLPQGFRGEGRTKWAKGVNCVVIGGN